MEKRSINWKDPNVRNILDKFLDRTLGIKTIPEFANYINNFCGTNIALSTIRNRVYQEQRERKLLLQGRQQATTTTTTTATSSPINCNIDPPDPEQPLNFLQALQAVPVMLNNGDGALMQAFALIGDTNPLLSFMSDNNGNLNQQTLLETLFSSATTETIPSSSNSTPPKLFPMTTTTNKSMKNKEIKDSQIILVDEPLEDFIDDDDIEEISDNPEQPLNFLQALQAVPVMLNNGDGALMQAFALIGDTNPLLSFMSDNNGNLNQQTLLETLFSSATTETIPSSSNSTPPKLFPMTTTTNKSMKNKEIKDSQIILVDEPLEDFIDDDDIEEISDSDEDEEEDDEFIKPKKLLNFHSLPIEFLQHFDSKSFKVDMGTLKQLSIFVREKLDYLTTATEIYPHHNSFMKTNIDAFKRNLDVIKQAGEYFEPLLSFEDDDEFFPNSLSEMTIALKICNGNNTGQLDQFYENSDENEQENLPGCRLTKQGMLNLVIILNGILIEAEELIKEYEQMKIKNKKINKIKMMMLTLQFSRFYRLAGKFANAAIISNGNDDKYEKLSKELNSIKMIKNDLENFFDDSEILPGTSNSFTNDWT
uniref:Uncharacterized protein n=1 Tax=Panagrolaimus sp. JU765 TaxID=591449 RepID=A0AC34QTB8_9BILA